MDARFITSAPTHHLLPELGLPEIAFAGRSNVGKSTLLGRVLGHPKLVRTSKTPGQTRLLNYFLWEEKRGLEHLPGYGYAKMSKVDKAQMQAMVQTYIAQRRHLQGLVVVLDARREEVTLDDRSVIEWAMQHHKPILLAITKSDTLSKSQRFKQMRCIEESIGAPVGGALMCSGKSGEGVKELVGKIVELTG